MNIFNATAQPTPDVVHAFSGIPKRELLGPGQRIYRFETLMSALHPNYRREKSTFESPWWFTADTFKQLCRTARATQQSLRDVGRSRLAVTNEWSPGMDWLAVAELKDHAYAWVGPVRTQPLNQGDRSVLLMGGYPQAWIPGLAGTGDGSQSPYALLIYYGSGGAAERM